MHRKLSSEDLMVILALSQEGTLEKAGLSLGKDGSSIFRAIKRIETKVGRALFTRSHAGFEPVPGSGQLLESAQLISKELAVINQMLENSSDSLSGELKITTTDLLLHDFITPHLPQFTHQYPEISLLFDSQNSVTKLWERNYDLAIRPSNKPPEQMLGSLIMTLEHQVMAQPCQLQPSQLQEGKLKPDCYWLLLGGEIANHSTVKWWRENFESADNNENKVIYYDSMLQIRNAVMAGLGVGCLPNFPTTLITDKSQTLQSLAQYGQFCPTEIWALYHPTNRQNPKIRAFIDFLKGLAKS